jgi:sugar phosphate isomerase/epimerase
VRLLVENLMSEPTTPEHLVTILEMGRLKNVGACLDLGHANVTVGVAEAIGTLGARIASVHVHDNHGVKDEHLWPGDGAIDWAATAAALKKLATPPALVLEISQNLGETLATIPAKIGQSFARFE